MSERTTRKKLERQSCQIEALRREIVQLRRILADILGHEPNDGWTNEWDKELLKQEEPA